MPTPIEQLLSRTVYATDGTTVNWGFSFASGYLDAAHVKAQTKDAAGAITQVTVTPGMLIGEFQLQITPALASGLTLIIYRDTPKNAPLVDFNDESGFSEIALDTNAKQAVMVAAEAIDTLNSSDLTAAIEAAESAGAAAAAASASAALAAASVASIGTSVTDAEAAAAAAIAAADSINPSNFATAAQGALADTAVQPAGLTVAAITDAGAFGRTMLQTASAGLARTALGFSTLGGTLAQAADALAARTAIGVSSLWTTLLAATSLNAVRAELGQMSGARQTVLNGPVDTNGNANFGGSTGGTSVTASATLTLSAANGVTGDRIGTVTNPQWSSLTTNGVMYLYSDIAADGTCTQGVTTLLPTYRWGGADVITTNQFTFNVQEMIGKVGNGSVAGQTYRVFVGEVLVVGGLVSTITWYALRSQAFIAQATIAASTSYALPTNLGTRDADVAAYLECKTNDGNFVVGDRVQLILGDGDGSISPGFSVRLQRNTVFISVAPYVKIANYNAAGAVLNVTLANWSFVAFVRRPW